MARGVRRRKSESTPSIRHSKAEGSIAPGVPEVYQSLLAETHPHSPTGEDRRNVKRRRIGGRLTTLGETKSATVLSFEASDSVDDLHIASSPMDTVAAPQQTIYNDFDDSDDSDMDWEDVKIGSETKRDEIGENETLTFIIGGHEETKSKQVTQRRKAMTGAERKVRLDVHKMHLLCLLVHVQLRNHWCNDPQVQVDNIL
jgi:xeroderma pigmentosum group C-complementing protein